MKRFERSTPDLGKLAVLPFNMRDGKRSPDISYILSSIRQRGIFQRLLVRPNGGPDSFEIVAGRRLYFAAKTMAEEGETVEPLLCSIMEAGDDETHAGQIVTDLFGEESYFADADTFWQAQNEAIAERKASYLEAG